MDNDISVQSKRKFLSKFQFSVCSLLLLVLFAAVLFSSLTFDVNNIRFLNPELQAHGAPLTGVQELISCEVENAGRQKAWFQTGNDPNRISIRSFYPVSQIPVGFDTERSQAQGFFRWSCVEPTERLKLYLPCGVDGEYWVGVDVKDRLGRTHTASAVISISKDSHGKTVLEVHQEKGDAAVRLLQ